MRWQHFLVMALLAVGFYWLGTKYPGYLTKATMGVVTG